MHLKLFTPFRKQENTGVTAAYLQSSQQEQDNVVCSYLTGFGLKSSSFLLGKLA
jgi:hypothetical protein